MGNPRAYAERYAENPGLDQYYAKAKSSSYGRNRPLVSPSQEMQYEWSVSPGTQSPTSPMSYNQANLLGSPTHYYGYPPVTAALSTYSSEAYGSLQADAYRRQSYPLMTARNSNTMNNGSPYSTMREYGHGQSASGIGSIDSICDQDVKHG
jgi:hypothetical protein